MITQESVPMLSLPSIADVQFSRLDTKQNPKRNFWKMIQKAKAYQSKFQPIIKERTFSLL